MKRCYDCGKLLRIPARADCFNVHHASGGSDAQMLLNQYCPMCGARKGEEPRLIGWRRDGLEDEFYPTFHKTELTRPCWHPFHEQTAAG